MTKVFISYSRKDKVFAGRLTEALQKSELETWIDWDDIPPTADWMDQIHKGIEQADAFLFLLSPDSVASKVCGQEVDHAVQNGKRLIPIVTRDVNPNDVHAALAKVNWIYCRENDDFDGAVQKTLFAIRTDLTWVEAHKRLQVRAIEWDKRKDGSLLLRGKDLREAEERIVSSGQKDPQPTDLQRQYLLESRRRETKTRNRLLTISSIASLLLVGLFILALIQLNRARSLVLSAKAQSAFSEENYQVAALYAYQSDQIYSNDTASQILGELPFKNYSIGKAFLGHQDFVRSVAWSQDGRLASGSSDNSVILWDIETRQPLQILRGNKSPVYSVAWSKDGKLSSAAGDQIIIWDLIKGQPLQTLDYSLSYEGGYRSSLILTIDWSPDGRLASGTFDGEVVIWDLETGQPAQILSGHTDTVKCVSWSPDGRLASASSDGKVIIWDLKTGQPAQILSSDAGDPTSIAWSQDGKLASGSSDKQVIIWDLNSGQPAQILSSEESSVVAWSQDGVLASGSYKVVLWNLKTGQPAQIFSGHTSYVTSIAWSKDGKLASGSWDTTIMLWEPGNQKFTQEFSGYPDTLSIAWAKDGRLASGSDDGKVIIWDLHTGRPKQVLSGHTELVSTLAWSYDGKLATGSYDGKVIIWDLETGQPEQILSGPNLQYVTNFVISIAWSPDGKLASGFLDNTIIIWDLETGQPAQILSGHSSTVNSVAWSREGKLASGSKDKTIIIWNLETGLPSEVLSGYMDEVNSVDWSYDGKLVSGSVDGKTIIWDLDTGRPAQILSVPASLVLSVAWSQDGELASNVTIDKTPAGMIPSASTTATASTSKKEIIIWDLTTGKPIKILQHSNWLGDSTWSPNGRLTVSASNAIYILRDDLLNSACETWFSRNMSFDEWLMDQGTFFVYKPACPKLPIPDFKISMSNFRENPSYAMNVTLITWQGRIILVCLLVIILATLYGVTRLSYTIISRVRRNL